MFEEIEMADTKKRYTPAEKARILKFLSTHTNAETQEKYGVSSYTLWYWQQPGGHAGIAKKRGKKANGADTSNLPAGGKPGRPPMGPMMEAAIHLQRWAKARMEHIRAGGDPQKYDLDAELALRALEQAKKK